MTDHRAAFQIPRKDDRDGLRRRFASRQSRCVVFRPDRPDASEEPLSFSGNQGLFPEFQIPLDQIPAQSVFRRKEDYRDYNLSKRFINIAEGCSFTCTFCTHKPGLGPRRSRPAG